MRLGAVDTLALHAQRLMDEVKPIPFQTQGARDAIYACQSEVTNYAVSSAQTVDTIERVALQTEALVRGVYSAVASRESDVLLPSTDKLAAVAMTAPPIDQSAEPGNMSGVPSP